MPRSLPRQITIEIDTREKLPLLFPKNIKVPLDSTTQTKIIAIKTLPAKLPAGDYRLAEYPQTCVIERKAGQNELITNLLTKDYKRFLKAITRLAETCSFPVLLIESTPSLLVASPKFPASPRGVWQPDQNMVIHRLSVLVWRLGINLILAGQSRTHTQRRNLGSFVAHLLVGTAFLDVLGKSLDKPARVG